jgi:hypothetical protein
MYRDKNMNNYDLFESLLRAETEEEVDDVLSKAGYLESDKDWVPLGFENNFAAISNQQSDPSGALVEKVINGIDAVLMAECYKRGVNPESPLAPQSMVLAVEQFFGIREGRLDLLVSSEQTALAEKIHLVAVGSKENPNYLIIDLGEGQTPLRFPDTFLSLLRSNKMRIPFVQGKFNSGGTGILQFCGNRNYQLIVSRRQPGCPVEHNDPSADLWGFTIVRRLLPAKGRRSSMYVYLAPNGKVPSFQSEAIKVLPSKSGSNRPAIPYANELNYGTCVKLYNYRWRAKSMLTTEGRYELERFLHSPCLPIRVTETRGYRANYYSATVSGGWVSATIGDEQGEGRKLEEGFPAYGNLNVEGIGQLTYQLVVYKNEVVQKRVPHGVLFLLNGQVHGDLPADFISRRLKFDYLTGKSGPLLVTVDCTSMDERVREDFFMASRDRIRKNEVYNALEKQLTDVLRNHPGLQELNQRRRKADLESHLEKEAPLEAFQKLLDLDPTLSSLFAVGDRLVTNTGPTARPPFIGRLFPTFFRLSNASKDGLVKQCPLNRTCRLEFETDASNDYFKRTVDPGRIIVEPPNLMEQSHLWNGRFEARFRVPWDATVGQEFEVIVTVTDLEREALDAPFLTKFMLKAAPETDTAVKPGPNHRMRGPSSNGSKKGVGLALPLIREVYKDEWDKYGFDAYSGITIRHNGVQGYDCFVNIDNTFLLTELARARQDDKPLVKFWFSYGLVLAALGMIKHRMRTATNDNHGPGSDNADEQIDLDDVSQSCSSLAQVIIPIIRTLSRGPTPESSR